jgi:hypothetical protein
MACRQDLNLLEGFGCAMRRLARTERSVGHRLSPRRERTDLECNVKNEYGSIVAPLAADPNFAFSLNDTRILIETPDKNFAEYVVGTPRRPGERLIICSPVPGGRGWQDQVAARILQFADDGAGTIVEWCSRHRTARRPSALVLIACETPCTETLMQPGPQDGLLLHQLTFVLSANRKE